MNTIAKLLGNNNNGNRQRRPKNRGRQQPRRRNGLESAKQGHTYKVNPGPSFFPQIPKELSVSLVDRLTGSAATGATGLGLTFGLIEFLNRKPLYLDQLFAIYKFCRITAVNYHFEVVNVSTGMPIEMIFAIIPFSDIASSTATTLGEKPGVIRHIISPIGGMDRRTMSKTAIAQDWMGNPYFSREYWVNASQASSTTPIDTEAPVGRLLIVPLIAPNTPTIVYTIKVTYHIQFFDLELPAESALTRAQSVDSSEDMVPPVLIKSSQKSIVPDDLSVKSKIYKALK